MILDILIFHLSKKMDYIQYIPWPFLFSRYLIQNLEWLEEGLGDFDNDYYLFDCPGKISSYGVNVSQYGVPQLFSL